MRFKNKVAIITGGGAGMGRAAALGFAKEGASLVLNDFNEDSLNSIIDEIRSINGSAIGVPGDITKGSTISTLVSDAIREYGKIDILFNYVGGEPGSVQPKFFLDQSEEYFDLLLNLNLKSTILLSRAVLDSMIKQKYGKIINTGAAAARSPTPKMALYATVKAAVIAFTKALAIEVAPYNINVNCVSPGPTLTPGFNKVFKDFDESLIMAVVPLKRYGNPEEIAKAVLYLASDDASFITGQSLAIDGGATMV